MSPISALRGRVKKTADRLIEVYADETEADIEGLGSTHFSREDLQRGLEPDECYYVQHAAEAAGKARWDFRSTRPPTWPSRWTYPVPTLIAPRSTRRWGCRNCGGTTAGTSRSCAARRPANTSRPSEAGFAEGRAARTEGARRGAAPPRELGAHRRRASKLGPQTAAAPSAAGSGSWGANSANRGRAIASSNVAGPASVAPSAPRGSP